MKKALLNKLNILGVIAYFALTPDIQAVALKLEEYRTESVLACIELVNPSFELSFIHSVSLTKVYDKYRIVDGNEGYKILQTEERFLALGQGLPSLVNEPDSVAYEHRNGQFILRLKRPINDLIVRTDRRFKNRLYTGRLIINLNQWPDMGLRIQPTDHCN